MNEIKNTVRTYSPELHRFIVVNYDRSYLARIIQGNDVLKSFYSDLKNEILAYGKPKARISWKYETFKVGRNHALRMQVRGKTLCLYLDLNPTEFIGSKYKIEETSNDNLACLYRINNPRRLKYAKELIAKVMEKHSLVKSNIEYIDYKLPFEDNEALVAKGLIKAVAKKDEEALEMTFYDSVNALEVDSLMSDDYAHHHEERSLRHADKTKKGIINIDTISDYFENGEVVTLDKIKKRVPNFDKKVTYLKVLARGVLNKALVVDADDFSIEAEKMILLTGGNVLFSLPSIKKN